MALSVSAALSELQQSASYTARNNAASIGTSSGSSTSANGAASQASGAFTSMASNESNFLNLLTTQLQHQDPTSPMKNDQLASQLAQFSAVEQQVQTNKNLSSLISLNETSQLVQNKNMVGQTASAQSNALPLQSGSASLSFSGSSGQVVAISVVNSAGQEVKSDVLQASGGNNTWSWDGKTSDGQQMPDGAYGVSVKTIDSAGNVSNVSFSVTGKITGVTRGNGGVSVNMGDVVIPMSDVQSLS